MKLVFVTILIAVGSSAYIDLQGEIVNGGGPVCPIDDPFIGERLVSVNFTLDPVFKLLEDSFVDDLQAVGSRTIWYSITLNPLILVITFEASIQEIRATGKLSVQGYLDVRPLRPDTFPSGNLTADNQQAVLNVSDGKIKGRALLNLNGPVTGTQITRLDLDEVNFSSIGFDFGNMEIGDKLHNWTEISKTFKQTFDADLNDFKLEIAEKLKLATNNILKNISLRELIDILNPREEDCDIMHYGMP